MTKATHLGTTTLHRETTGTLSESLKQNLERRQDV